MRECRTAGRFFGKIGAAKCGKTKESGVLQFMARLVLTEEIDPTTGDSVKLKEELSITAFLTLTKKDGTPNKNQVDSLKSALGWDGKSLKGLCERATLAELVQVTVSEEEDEAGNPRYVVDWINSSSGGFKKQSPEEIEALEGAWQEASGVMAGDPDDDIAF